jgi:multidrug efflux pump subunit AcrA (membrane-fusion protein)
MVIILCLYIVALWLVFSKFKLVRWGWLSGTVAVLIGVFILAIFLALFNYLTPSGRVTVTGRVVEVTPNVTGQIVAIPVKPNVPVKANDVLFQIDPAPFQYKVSQLQASLAAAKQQTEILKSNYEQATANVTGLTAQVAFNAKRNADILKLATEGANTEFQAQDRQNQYETALAQLNVAKAAQQSAKLAGFRDRWRQYDGRADSGAARQCELGAVADDHSRARRWLCDGGSADGRRPGAAVALGDVVHCRERDHARRHVFAEWFSDHQGRRIRRYRFR